jgi:hypothetical protein
MPETISISCTPFDAPLSYRLQRKAEDLGPIPIDHWWMPIQSVYPTTRNEPGNYRAIVDGYWQLCRREGSSREPDAAESYLLARLLPLARPVGSRRVVADARLRTERKARAESAATLQATLAADPLEPMSAIDFRDQTGRVMGPCDMTAEDQARYLDVCRQLFSGPLRRLPEDDTAALDELRRTWLGWANGFARRTGRDADKRVLDVLSYEMRAALHRCYSAVWSGVLLPHLRDEYRLSVESSRFLAFWHLEQSRESEAGSPAYFHLFHAQAFGLHPAGSEFIRTPAGRALLGEWLRSGGDPESRSYGRLLRGLYLAVFHYADRRERERTERPIGSQLRSEANSVTTSEAVSGIGEDESIAAEVE